MNKSRNGYPLPSPTRLLEHMFKQNLDMVCIKFHPQHSASHLLHFLHTESHTVTLPYNPELLRA